MASMTIRDDSLWAKHVHDETIRDRIVALKADETIRLVVDGEIIAFRKMRNGVDGRQTPGLRADEDDLRGRAVWAKLQQRRGEVVTVTTDDPPPVDPYLAYLDDFLWEWRTPEDAAAFDGL